MGSSKKKTKTTPIYDRQITGAANTLSNVYGQQAPKINEYANALGDVGMDLLSKYQAGNPMIDAAEGYITSTLGADSAANPYLDDMIAQTNDSVRNQVQAARGTRGTTGGSAYNDLIARALAQNETGLRYTDFNNMEARKAQAAGLAPGVAAGDFLTLAPALSSIGAASQLPMDSALRYAAGTGGLLGGYTNTEQKQSPGLMGILGTGLQAASLFSDERLKTDIRRVGETDEGLGVYTYRIGDGPTQMGVMAQEVMAKKPDALGEPRDGFLTVDYGRVA